MAREIATGVQDFSELREKHAFYVDKTAFIREWWNAFFPINMRAEQTCLKDWMCGKMRDSVNCRGLTP